KVKGPRLHIGTERYQLLTRSFKEREELVMVASKIGVDVAEQLGSSLNPRMDFVRYIPIEELLLDSLVRESLVRRINDKPKSNETE
ncbi:MAG: hypothetical protein K2X81_13715, partial [Candidatus Obscuribacterales bacterium]|nr:hypothetical protein [Candidatus Obscuribacterales bacterium]